jgi:hypothetical protein
MHRIRVGVPGDKNLDRKAQDYFTDSVGLALYLQGSRSPFLKSGTDVIEQLADQYKTSALGTKLAVTLANGVSKPFFRVTTDDPNKSDLKQTASADPKQALDLTKTALDQFRSEPSKTDNLAYGRLVLRRCDYHRAMGDDADANRELAQLSADLAKRDVNTAVIDKYRNMSGNAAPQPPAAPSAARRAGSRNTRTSRRKRSA